MTATKTAAQDLPATIVGVDEVRTEPLSQTIPVIGRVVSERAGRIAAQVAGAVKTVHVQVGERVEAGQLIAELDRDTKVAEARVLAAQIQSAKADLEVARAELTLAEQELQRQSKLQKSGAFSKSRFDTAQQEVQKARSRILRDQAIIATRKASASVTKLEIDRSRIIASFDGVVVEKLTEAGSYVRIGDPVARLLSDTELEVEADVPAVRIGGIKPGYRVRATLEDGMELSATVRSMLPVENPMTRTRTVRFIPNWPSNATNIADSQSVTVHLPIGPSRDVVTVHKDAIIRKSGQAVVYVIEDSTAASRQVQLGEATGSRIVVLVGLKAGEITVVRGNERLQPGAKVKIRTGS
ncbi:MAG: efflux RND transporter periplasmic adaptor subunit [Aestuariivirgaceae bacterium]